MTEHGRPGRSRGGTRSGGPGDAHGPDGRAPDDGPGGRRRGAGSGAIDRCVAAGGVVVFPADTVYGVGCDPENADAVGRLYELKGRPANKPAAVMWGRLEIAVAALDELGPRTRGALERLLPGPVTVLLANPAGRYPLAGTGLLGVRVPAGRPAFDGPLLQSSANLAGGPDARRLTDVPRAIRDGADLLVDGGELPGVPSTVVDLSAYETGGGWLVVREGALPAGEIAARLARRRAVDEVGGD